jgi:SLT domain-containing protein
MVRRELCKRYGGFVNIWGARSGRRGDLSKSSHGYQLGGRSKEKYLLTGCTINAEWEALILLYKK